MVADKETALVAWPISDIVLPLNVGHTGKYFHAGGQKRKKKKNVAGFSGAFGLSACETSKNRLERCGGSSTARGS